MKEVIVTKQELDTQLRRTREQLKAQFNQLLHFQRTPELMEAWNQLQNDYEELLEEISIIEV